MQKVDFFLLNDILLNLGAVTSPAELQGMLCGRMCGGDESLSQAGWLNDALKFLDLEGVSLNVEQSSPIEDLYLVTTRLLADANFSFTPMLPSDEATISRRTEELGLWCQGFLHGLGTSGLRGEAELSGDVADALRDLAQIAQVKVGDEDELEENEAYWVELVEYLKVAVLTIYAELGSQNSGGQAASSTSNMIH